MDEQHKGAYRYLLYLVMLDVRPFYWMFDEHLFSNGLRLWNIFYWRKHRSHIRHAGLLAEWMHNLAKFSANDFRGFDEDYFWQQHEEYMKCSAGDDLKRLRSFRKAFEARLEKEPENITKIEWADE